MTSFWFEVFALIGLAFIVIEISLFKRTYAKVETVKLEEKERLDNKK